jgi:hypothetical protein
MIAKRHNFNAAPESAGQGSASWFALAIALGAGVSAFVAPAFSLLILAALAAHTLMRTETIRLQPLSLAGPIFAALIVGAFTGLAGGIGVLFAWRMFADTRWSVSEAQRLALAAGRPGETSWRALAHAWATPLFGLTLVAYTAPHMIAGLPLDLPHVPMWVPIVAGALATGAVVDWALQRAADWRLGELAAAPATHLLTHHVLFILAFGLMIDVSAGIVALAAWRLAYAAPLRQASLTAVP